MPFTHNTQGLISLLYTTLIICGVHVCKTLGLPSWRIAALLSLPGDLTCMGLCIAKITILSFSGLPADCHGLTRDNCKLIPNHPCISNEGTNR